MKRLLIILFLFSSAQAQILFRTNAVVNAETMRNAPVITNSTGSLTAFTNTAGTASTEQSFTVSGTDIAGSATITAPSGFEVSLDNATYAGTRTVTVTSRVFTSQPVTIYVRVAAATTAGSYSGNVTVASLNATTKNVAVSATVSAAPTPNDTLNVNIWDGSVGNTADSKWNNWHPTDGTGTAQTSGTLNWSTGSSSGMTMTLGNGASGYTDNGSGWAAATSSTFPAAVWRSTWYFIDATNQVIRFNNVPTGTYKIEFCSSRNTGTSRNQTVTFGGTGTAINAQNNINTIISWTGLTRDGSNQIAGTITPTGQSASTFTYVTAIRLIRIN